MSVKIFHTKEVQDFLRVASGLDNSGGNPRTKQIVHRLLSDLYKAIDDLDITPDEFWAGVSYVNDLGGATEAGLLTPGLGIEHYLDMRLDAADAAAGIATGTARTIEGPLYVAGAPVADGFARLDDGSDAGGAPLIMQGVVRGPDGNPVADAVVEVWHCNSKGMYSFFDKSQSPFNMRRTIRTDAQGRYKFQSIVPNGYGCPPNGPTQALLTQLGRHGQRPAHIHFFVYAPGHRKLTTQINIAGDKYLYDDFAYATREELIPPIVARNDAASIEDNNLHGPFVEIDFDFVLIPISGVEADAPVERRRVAL